MQTDQRNAAAPTWELWQCDRCATENRFRGFCGGCGVQLDVEQAVAPRVPAAPPAPEAAPAPDAVADAAPAAVPQPLPTKRKARRWVALAVAVVVLGSVAGYATLGRRAPRRYPAAWDPRVVDLVSFVETERGLTFDHPVFVDFLTPGEYHKVTTTDSSSLSAEDKRELERGTGMLRALGLVTGKVDLLAASNTLSDDGTLAFYDPATEHVTVRGTEITPSLRVTLVHELTHALQDQHFDIGRERATDGEASAFRALIEGDAMRIEDQYVDELSDDDAAAYDKQAEQDAADADTDLTDVPPALSAFFGAPYALGSKLVTLLDDDGGNRAVDDAMATPPRTDAELLDPFRFLSHELAQTVKTPTVDSGDKRGEEQEFGAVALYFVLAARLDAKLALLATDVWDGDAAVDYTHDGKQCFRVAFAPVAGHANELQGILSQWARTMPPGTASVDRVGGTVNLQSCDPGEAAAAGTAPGASIDSLMLPLTRTAIAAELLRGGAGRDQARCVAGRMVDTFSVEQFNDPEPDAQTVAAIQKRVKEYASACG